MGDLPKNNELILNEEIFNGWIVEKLAIHIGGLELDTFDPDDRLTPFKRLFEGNPQQWLGNFGPSGEEIDMQNPGGWKLWYRIELVG